jgi:ATP-dependent DNA ligase
MTCFQIGTGFSDEALQTHTDFLKKNLINEPRNYYNVSDSVCDDSAWATFLTVLILVET